MGKDKIVLQGQFDIRKAYKILGQIKGDRYGYEVRLKSLRPREEKDATEEKDTKEETA